MRLELAQVAHCLGHVSCIDDMNSEETAVGRINAHDPYHV
jgi:hypothetical protein